MMCADCKRIQIFLTGEYVSVLSKRRQTVEAGLCPNSSCHADPHVYKMWFIRITKAKAGDRELKVTVTAQSRASNLWDGSAF